MFVEIPKMIALKIERNCAHIQKYISDIVFGKLINKCLKYYYIECEELVGDAFITKYSRWNSTHVHTQREISHKLDNLNIMCEINFI